MARKKLAAAPGNALVPATAIEIMEHRRRELVLELVDGGEQGKIFEELLKLTPLEVFGDIRLSREDGAMDQVAKHLFLVLVEDVIDLEWTAVPAYPWSKKFMKSQFTGLIKNVSGCGLLDECEADWIGRFMSIVIWLNVGLLVR